MNKYAPIILFTYKRLDSLRETVSSLLRNGIAAECELFIFSDGGKSTADWTAVQLVRNYLKTINGFQKVTIFEAEKNMGLANSIITGVSKIINIYERVIVLEDDLIVTSNFLSFMNACLNKYKDSKNVFSISGYSFDLGLNDLYNEEAYFLNRGWSWGWGTWKNCWDKVDWSMKDYRDFAKSKIAQKEFAKGGSDLNSMLRKQMNGEIDSWDICWFYGQHKSNGLTIYPIFSKVYNNGFDKEATHTNGSAKRYIPVMDKDNKDQFLLPAKPAITEFYQKRFLIKMGIKARIMSRIGTIYEKVFQNIMSF